MFNIIANGMQAIHQGTMLLGGLVLALLGIALGGNALHWALHAERVRATVKGVRVRNGFYYLVYTYMLSDGTTHESTSDVGTGAVPKAPTAIRWSCSSSRTTRKPRAARARARCSC